MPNEKKPIDWNAIRAEYIGGGISQRKLAKKYGVSDSTLTKKANRENWNSLKEDVRNKAATKAQQKAINVASDNAAIAQRIKQKLLIRLEHEIDNLPQTVGTEVFSENVTKGKNGERKVKGIKYKLNDLTQAYKNLVGDIPEINALDEAEDNFLEALSGTAADDWTENDETEDSDV